uniref:EB domain-containing protein n=1 Tax=Strigamia maritima TaxID=126957 RepID=T1IJU3_STRMM
MLILVCVSVCVCVSRSRRTALRNHDSRPIGVSNTNSNLELLGELADLPPEYSDIYMIMPHGHDRHCVPQHKLPTYEEAVQRPEWNSQPLFVVEAHSSEEELNPTSTTGTNDGQPEINDYSIESSESGGHINHGYHASTRLLKLNNANNEYKTDPDHLETRPTTSTKSLESMYAEICIQCTDHADCVTELNAYCKHPATECNFFPLLNPNCTDVYDCYDDQDCPTNTKCYRNICACDKLHDGRMYIPNFAQIKCQRVFRNYIITQFNSIQFNNILVTILCCIAATSLPMLKWDRTKYKNALIGGSIYNKECSSTVDCTILYGWLDLMCHSNRCVCPFNSFPDELYKSCIDVTSFNNYELYLISVAVFISMLICLFIKRRCIC